MDDVDASVSLVCAVEAGSGVNGKGRSHQYSASEPFDTVGSMLRRWQTKVLPSQELSARTPANYEWACTILIDDLGKLRLRNLTADDIEHAFHRRAEHGMSCASLIKVRSVLGTALDHALRRGHVNSNVARIVDPPANARRPGEGRALTAQQARELLTASQDHALHPLWTLMTYTGLRPGEACGLTWADIDIDDALLHVRRSLKLEHSNLIIDHRPTIEDRALPADPLTPPTRPRHPHRTTTTSGRACRAHRLHQS